MNYEKDFQQYMVNIYTQKRKRSKINIMDFFITNPKIYSQYNEDFQKHIISIAIRRKGGI